MWQLKKYYSKTYENRYDYRSCAQRLVRTHTQENLLNYLWDENQAEYF